MSYLSKRQPCHHRWLSKGSAHIHNSAGTANDSTVAPSQVLRYALSGEPETHTATIRKTTRNKINHDLELILSKRGLDRQHQHGRLISLPGGACVPTELRNVSDLQELKLWFEQYIAAGFGPVSDLDTALKDALIKCEKSSSSLEILSVLTTVKSRHKDAGVLIHKAIMNSGLYYAFQSFSVPAIRHHLASYIGHLDVKTTKELTQCLLRTLRTVRFTDPTYDTRPILKLVADKPTGPATTFLSIAQFGEGTFSPFIELLCELGANKAHKDIWNKLVNHIVEIQRSSEVLTSDMLDDAYKSVMSFLKFGKTGYAMSCMDFISKTFTDMSPSLHLSTELAAILNEKGLEVPTNVEAPIQEALSQALEHYTAPTHETRFNDGMADFSIVHSLLERINDNGTSVSASRIAILIDALNDCAGLTIPLCIEALENHGMEYAWSPQWIPGVSDSSTISFSMQESQTLGLLRAQIASRGIVVTSDRSRNLIQLGHLVRRKFVSDGAQEDAADPWSKTGYLVVFDRISAEYLILYIGEDVAIIDPEYRLHTEHDSIIDYKQHPLLGSLSHVSMPTSVEDFDRDIGDVITPVKNAANRYVLDLDPGVSLQP